MGVVAGGHWEAEKKIDVKRINFMGNILPPSCRFLKVIVLWLLSSQWCQVNLTKHHQCSENILCCTYDNILCGTYNKTTNIRV